jgi:hypothetical protein
MNYYEEINLAATDCIETFGYYGKIGADLATLSHADRIAKAFDCKRSTVVVAIDDRIAEIV